MRTLVTAVLALGLFASFFAAEAGEKKPVVGFASREMVNDYNRGIVEGARKVVEAAGGTLVTTDGQADIRKHIDNINSFVTRGVDGILVQLGDPEQFAAVFAKAKAAGIPVVTTSIGQTSPDALCDVNGDDDVNKESRESAPGRIPKARYAAPERIDEDETEKPADNRCGQIQTLQEREKSPDDFAEDQKKADTAETHDGGH